MFPRESPELSIVIEGSIGELPMFHSTFGYYAHGVDESNAILPDGWRDRLVKIESPRTMGAVKRALEPNDLAASKLSAGRKKDQPFVRLMIEAGLATSPTVRTRLRASPRLPPERLAIALATLDRWDQSQPD